MRDARVPHAPRPGGQRADRRACAAGRGTDGCHPGRGSRSVVERRSLADHRWRSARRPPMSPRQAAPRPDRDRRSRCRPDRCVNVDSQAAENDLHSVYASSVFADLDQNQPPSLFARIGAAINWILSHLFGLLGNGGSIAARRAGARRPPCARHLPLPRRRRRAARDRSRMSRDCAATIPTASGGSRWPPRSVVTIARRFVARSALRCSTSPTAGRYLDRAWTTREMLATLSMDADLLAVVAPAAASFDKAWYGGGSVDAADWEVARSRCDAVRRVARHAAAKRQ